MSPEFENLLTAYLIAQFAIVTQQSADDIRVEYCADEERTTIAVRHHSGDNYEYYDCIAGSDDDMFVFVPRSCPDNDDMSVGIEFPDAPWFMCE